MWFVSSAQPESGERKPPGRGRKMLDTQRAAVLSYTWRRGFFQLPALTLIHFREQLRDFLTVIHFHKQKSETDGIELMAKGHGRGLRLQR